MLYRQVQPQPVNQADAAIVLDQTFADNAVLMMKELGAQNATPPLPPSTHLKNKYTGVIFPWSAALAEQRDILVNCDASGNTDPAAWKHTMLAENDIPSQNDLMQQAYANLRQSAVPNATFMQSEPPRLNTEERPTMPHGAQTLDNYLNSVKDMDITQESAASLEQLSQAMD